MEYSECGHCTICVHLYGACTKKRNIENERNVHGKRLRVFSTKGEKLSCLEILEKFWESLGNFGEIL